MTFDKELDPKTWRADKTSLAKIIDNQAELIEHQNKQIAKWQRIAGEYQQKCYKYELKYGDIET